MKKVGLNELLGKSAGNAAKTRKLGLKDLPDLFGDRSPKLEYSPRGRYRLLTALRNRFGDGYRNIEGVSDILKEFDEEAAFNVKVMEMRNIKGKR